MDRIKALETLGLITASSILAKGGFKSDIKKHLDYSGQYAAFTYSGKNDIPNISTKDKTLDLGKKPVIKYGDVNVEHHKFNNDWRSIHLPVEQSSNIIVYFDLSTYKFKAVASPFEDISSDDELAIVAVIRWDDDCIYLSGPISVYTVDGTYENTLFESLVSSDNYPVKLKGYDYSGDKIKLERNKIYLEKVIRAEDVGGIQSITYHTGKLYVAYDIGHGYSTILIYEYPSGRLIKEVKHLGVGHASDMSYRECNNTLWISSQGEGKTKPAGGPDDGKQKWLEVDIESDIPTVVDYIESGLPRVGPISIDNNQDILWTAIKINNQREVRAYDFSNKTVIKSKTFTVTDYVNPGQGSALLSDKFYFFKGGTGNNAIETYDLVNKEIESNPLKWSRNKEPEGIAMVNDSEHPHILVCYRDRNIYKINF